MPNFPIAPKILHEITQHGTTRIDEYFWMRDKENPETLKYLRSESDYLEEMLGHTKPLQEKLFIEMKGRIKETDSTVPEKRGEYFHYERMERGRQYPIFCRKKGSLDAPEEIVLDQNILAEGKTFCSVGAVSLSPDGTKLAYSVDFGGAEVYTIHIKDLVTGALYDESIENTSGNVYDRGGVEWANDNRTIFYVTLDAAQRPDKLFRHTIGTDPASDVLILHESDDAYFLWMYKTRDDRFIVTYHYSTLTREMRFLDADHPEGELRILQPRVHGLEYYAAHHNGKFFVVHNHNAKNFKLGVSTVENPGMDYWIDILPHRQDVLVEGVDAFEKHLVVRERKDGLKQIRISAPDDVQNARYVKFPEPVYSVNLSNNPEFETDLLRFEYSSMITPNSIIDYHMDTDEWEIKKEDEIPSGYDKSLYESERIYASAPDGARVPISLVYRRGVNRDGSNPLLLYGYGAYGSTIDAAFNPNRLSLLDRGFIFAIAHIRGGSEMGRAWYESGRMFNKKNTFTDFIACAEHLVNEKYTSKEKLAIQGVSAGGLLMGAVTTMRPDLFKAVIAKVPFVDVVTSMSDPSIPLTTLEWNEWGNPQIREEFEYMMSYSPYNNLRAATYPHMLITTGLNDPRVAFWEPAKFTARLRELKTDDNLIVFYTNYDSGHAGSSGRYDYLKEVALEYAFLLDRLTNNNSA